MEATKWLKPSGTRHWTIRSSLRGSVPYRHLDVVLPATEVPLGLSLLDTRFVAVATPEYLERHGRPAKPADLANHVCIQVRSPVTGKPIPWEFQRGRKVITVPTSGRLLLTEVGK